MPTDSSFQWQKKYSPLAQSLSMKILLSTLFKLSNIDRRSTSISLLSHLSSLGIVLSTGYLSVQCQFKLPSGWSKKSEEDRFESRSVLKTGQEIGFSEYLFSRLCCSSRSKLDLRETRLLVTVGAPSVEESCSQVVVMSSFLFRFRRGWRTETISRTKEVNLKLLEATAKKENRKALSEGVMGNLSLYIAREPPSTSLATVLVAQNKRIGPSLADRSRVELALLPRLSLTRLSRTQSLGGSFLLHSLAITRRERSNQDRAGEARRGWMSERLKESVLKTEVLIGIPGVRIPLHPRGHKFSLAYR
ncbi:hypothetical protein L2E82_52830 [Cichorium intybus]|nr:hypothetical protein L2E82_52830 [Cichorium intybus]